MKELSLDEMKKALNEISISGKEMIIDFYSDWCAPSQSHAPVYEQMEPINSNEKDICLINFNMAED